MVTENPWATPHEKKQRDYLNKVIGSASRGGQPDLTPIAQSAPTTMPSNNGEANGTKAAGAVPSATLPQ